MEISNPVFPCKTDPIFVSHEKSHVFGHLKRERAKKREKRQNKSQNDERVEKIYSFLYATEELSVQKISLSLKFRK